MKNTVNTMCALLLASMALSSCIRQGCTDEVAFNYDKNASKDNKNCLYSSTMLVWFTPQTANQFYTQFGTNYFYLFVDDLIINSMANYDATQTAPDCQKSADVFEIFMGSQKSKTVTLKFLRPNLSGPDAVVKAENITIRAGECFIYELTF